MAGTAQKPLMAAVMTTAMITIVVRAGCAAC